MNLYLAPMEGITGYLFRNAFFSGFGGVDKYFTPFITTHTKKDMNSRERKDILPEHNQGIRVVPQIISKDAADSIRLIFTLHEQYGYDEVNLNLGCPSGTVVAKGRGAGFLACPKELCRYLDAVYEAITPEGIAMSVKTRIGMEDPEEFHELFEIYQQFPVSELIIHPRVQKDFYKNEPRMEVFREALEESRCPVVYNGNIFSRADYEAWRRENPSECAVMLGRGLISNPALALELKGEGTLEKDALEKFHDRLYRAYREDFSGDKNALFKLKELWFYWGKQFADADRLLKKIKKAKDFAEYETAVRRLFAEAELAQNAKIVF